MLVLEHIAIYQHEEPFRENPFCSKIALPKNVERAKVSSYSYSYQKN